MICGLGLNVGYSRDRHPIDVKKRFRDLTLDDYRLFTEFWFDPKNSVSERTAKNYICGLQQIIHTLRIKLPDGADELFKVRSTTMPFIAKYDAVILRTFLKCDDERARLFSMMFLNFGYYPVDIIGLLFEHITDGEGEAYVAGEMFITKRRERTTHQNNFATTAYVWPETQELIQKHRSSPNPFGTFFLSSHQAPYNVKTVTRLRDLTIEEYETFVRFWCDPKIVKSPRTGKNYIQAFRQMLLRLKVPRPDGFDETFTLKIPKNRKIAPYNAAMLKVLLNCKNERARLFALLCLNCGFYAIDIIRLAPHTLRTPKAVQWSMGNL